MYISKNTKLVKLCVAAEIIIVVKPFVIDHLQKAKNALFIGKAGMSHDTHIMYATFCVIQSPII